MLIAILFFAMMLVFDYLGLVRYRGQFIAFIFVMVAFALVFLTLTAAVISIPTTYPQITINSTTGNTIIQSYNVTEQPSPTSNAFIIPSLDLLVFLQFVFIFWSIAGWFLYRRKKKYGIT